MKRIVTMVLLFAGVVACDGSGSDDPRNTSNAGYVP